MLVRETMHAKKSIGLGAGVLMIIVAAVAIVAQTRSERPAGNGSVAFFSDDDGQTWFTESIEKFPPFDHNGKPAFRAAVYHSDGGRPFVAYLQRFRHDALKQLQDAGQRVKAGQSGPETLAALLASQPIQQGGSEVEVPGSGKWIPAYQFNFRTINDPNGKPAQPVDP